MGDVICQWCGEPWDFYGMMNGDMDQVQARWTLEGKGCPSCGFNHTGQPKHEMDRLRSIDDGTDLDPTEFI